MSAVAWLINSPRRIQAIIEEQRPDHRKCRLFAVARCRGWWDKIVDPTSRELIDLTEQFIDDRRLESRLTKLRRAVHRWAKTIWNTPKWPKDWIAHWAAWNAAVPAILPPCFGYFSSDDGYRTIAADIFGNPFRSVVFDPRWRSESAVALARTAYDTRDFALLPILADALEEAGCDHPDVLTHCRDPQQVHVRGCWVVDGVLGRS